MAALPATKPAGHNHRSSSLTIPDICGEPSLELAVFLACRVGFGWAALVFGGLLWAAAHAVHTWPAAFGLPPATGQATAAV